MYSGSLPRAFVVILIASYGVLHHQLDGGLSSGGHIVPVSLFDAFSLDHLQHADGVDSWHPLTSAETDSGTTDDLFIFPDSREISSPFTKIPRSLLTSYAYLALDDRTPPPRT